MPRSQGTSRKGKPGKHDRAAGMGKALQKAQQGGGGQQRYRPKFNGKSRTGDGGMQMNPHNVQSVGLEKDIAAAEHNKTKSVLEVQDVDDFLQQASMANREFTSEREGLVVLDATGQVYRGPSSVKWEDESKSDGFVFTELSVPRRPAWDETTTPAELEHNERQAFLEWRRGIAHKEEELMRNPTAAEQTAVTPFEKNLEVWRQLWRVLERSACLLQLVDARNPLFYLSQDLKQYASSLGKPMMVLINKSDYLSSKQRAVWRDYLTARGWTPVFFSASLEQQKLDEAAQRERREMDRIVDSRLGDDNDGDDEDSSDSDKDEELVQVSQDGMGVDVPLSRQQLLQRMLDFAKQHDCQPDARYDNRIQFGMVGFPNVGKSSVINVLMGSSKHTHGMARVAVAAQPGKTKHFQTLLLPGDEYSNMMLCDCPGLVFPSFVSNTADLIAAGVYPIAQMRDHWPVTNLIAQRIPREIINAQYGITMPVPTALELRERGRSEKDTLPPPTGEEFLTTFCLARSMLTASSGLPNHAQAARVVIKDYADGKLLYCHAPPMDDNSSTIDTVEFYRETVETILTKTKKLRDNLLKQQEKEKRQQQQEAIVVAAQHHHAEQTELDIGDPEAAVDDIEDDDLLEFLGGDATSAAASSSAAAAAVNQRNKQSVKKKKWGKKNRKNRNSDPYGCHSTPDEELLEEIYGAGGGNHSGGVSVNAGKRGKKGYTRPTAYGGSRGGAAPVAKQK